MSSLLANATPGQAVTVFVGSGQRLGLVGGVVYEHPIAVTALPAAGVAAQPALLAVAALNRSSAADGGGVAAPLAASDLAAGFPALEIRVDPADRCATRLCPCCLDPRPAPAPTPAQHSRAHA